MAKATRHENTPAVRVACLCQFSKDRQKIFEIEGNQYAVVDLCERQQSSIIQAIQCSLFVGGPHIMTHIPKCLCDPTTRNMGIQKEAHRLWPWDQHWILLA